MITVYSAPDITALMSARLALEAEQIPFMTQGEGVQDLFGFGRMITGFNPITGPVEIRVRDEDAERARAVLAELADDA
ncbi:MAG: DUF2007 domain-containing protein [Gemmatimonadetes bacterium]|nr:DUF2007 domain-containing protein [Gemmatimonadota bacterium]MCA9762540.1 DUF2007 domain-containing protein [Gemmatimonadota bacterium]MCB9504631.1 DUF2007 domain-containing protein [Gemmatimonadales bacterium]HPF61107.1 DUF2007 domain-containing protein [Gemmatimonadales bacterium]HRX18737.1 DUF2007 domain-containing protein [Gemmatimonadales bacterium]